MRPLPSFRSIAAFVTVARAQSLTQAAGLLGLSVPALSRRIRLLEADPTHGCCDVFAERAGDTTPDRERRG